MLSLKKAQKIATEAHKNQTRKTGDPYIVHPSRVAKYLAVQGMKEHVQIVGLLHDVIEDSPNWSFDHLRENGADDQIIEPLQLLTKPNWIQKEGDYIDSYIRPLSKNPVARAVKMADLFDNLTDGPERIHPERYIRAMEILAKLGTPDSLKAEK